MEQGRGITSCRVGAAHKLATPRKSLGPPVRMQPRATRPPSLLREDDVAHLVKLAGEASCNGLPDVLAATIPALG